MGEAAKTSTYLQRQIMTPLRKTFFHSALLSLTVLATGACATLGIGGKTSGTSASTKPADSHALDRTESIGEISTAVCERHKACSGFGQGKKYASQSDCEIQQRDEFNSRWPESDCGAHGLVKDKYIDCRERIKQYQCSSNVFDLGAILVECGAGKVCK
jgi:hypothetical protein